MEINEDDNLINTCHINIYISNNALSRGYIRKDPDIIRVDYCYINDKGTKYEKQYYIEKLVAALSDEDADRVVELLDNGKRIDVDTPGHDIHYDKPKEFTEILVGFMKEL